MFKSNNTSPALGFNMGLEIEKQVDLIQALAKEISYDQTLNYDCLPYQGGGLGVAIANQDYGLRRLSLCRPSYEARERLDRYKEAGIDVEDIKIGLLKPKNRFQLSLDLIIVIPQKFRQVAVDYSKWAGHTYLWDFDKGQRIASGTIYRGPRSIGPERCAKIIDALKSGVLPDVVDLTEHERITKAT